MPIANKMPDVKYADIKRGIAEDVEALLDEKEGQILGLMDSSEVKVVGVNFSVSFDFSEGEATAETKMKFGQFFTAKRVRKFGDPNQTTLPLDSRNGHSEEEGTKTESGTELSVEQTMDRNKKRQRAKETADKGD
jgi:hypothetical protein